MTSSAWTDCLVMRVAELQGKDTRQGALKMTVPAADLFQKCSSPCSKERSGVRLVLMPACQVVEAE